jgi:hypothetical protein
MPLYHKPKAVPASFRVNRKTDHDACERVRHTPRKSGPLRPILKWAPVPLPAPPAGGAKRQTPGLRVWRPCVGHLRRGHSRGDLPTRRPEEPSVAANVLDSPNIPARSSSAPVAIRIRALVALLMVFLVSSLSRGAAMAAAPTPTPHLSPHGGVRTIHSICCPNPSRPPSAVRAPLHWDCRWCKMRPRIWMLTREGPN